jgi:hypothetical protein
MANKIIYFNEEKESIQQRMQDLEGLARNITRKEKQTAVQPTDKTYIPVKDNSYGQALHTLREQASEPHPLVVHSREGTAKARPLTFKETIEARVQDYNKKKHLPEEEGTHPKLELLNIWLDTCTGIAYKAGTTQFTIIPVSRHLLEVNKDFNEASITTDIHFERFLSERSDKVLDSTQGKYNEPLTPEEVLKNPGWLAGVEGDTDLLRAYRDIVFAELGNPDKAMSFYVLQNTHEDEVRALVVCNLNYDSDAGGDSYLDDDARFLRVAHATVPKAPRTPIHATPLERKNTYAAAIQHLQEQHQQGHLPAQPTITINGRTYARPLTLKETLIAKLTDFHTLHDTQGNERSMDDRLQLFNQWLHTCTGIAYKAGTTKIKIKPVCNQLITIPPTHNQQGLYTPYEHVEGIELDTTQDTYRTHLPPEHIPNHHAWQAAIEGDTQLLKDYTEAVLIGLQHEDNLTNPDIMGFRTLSDPQQDQVRVLVVLSLYGGSGAGGGNGLYDNSRFLRVSPR